MENMKAWFSQSMALLTISGIMAISTGCALRSQMIEERLIERNEDWIGRNSAELEIKRGSPDYVETDPSAIEYWTYERTRSSSATASGHMDRETLDQQLETWTETVTFVIGADGTIQSVEASVN